MEKYLTYSVVRRKDPTNFAGEGLFYGQAQARGEAGIRELSKRIQQMCTVTRADVMAVLIALEDVVSEALSNGEIVRLGELGSLQVSFSSEGVEKKEMFNDTYITTKRILFRSGMTLSNMLETLRYQQVEQKYFKDGEAPVVDPDGNDDGQGGGGI